MPFDGSGGFSNLYDWESDASADIKIRADRHRQNDNDVAQALSNTICRDGQSQVAADISWNSHRITNLADPTADQDAASKAYVDTRTNFATDGLILAGGDDKGRVVFTGSQSPLDTGKPIGLVFTQADLFFGVKPLDVSVVGNLPRWVWNNQADGLGVDVANMTETGLLTLAGELRAKNIIRVSADTGNVHIALYGPATSGDPYHTDSERMMLYAPAAADGTVVLRVGGATAFNFFNNGSFQAPLNVMAGSAYLQQNSGNVIGSVWTNWGASDAYSAISARIESRADAWAQARANACVQSTRMAGETAWNRSGVTGKWQNSAYVITGVQGTSPGGDATYYARQPQVYYPIHGWVAAFPF